MDLILLVYSYDYLDRTNRQLLEDCVSMSNVLDAILADTRASELSRLPWYTCQSARRELSLVACTELNDDVTRVARISSNAVIPCVSSHLFEARYGVVYQMKFSQSTVTSCESHRPMLVPYPTLGERSCDMIPIRNFEIL